MIHVDAANPRSYPGSGTSWYNLANSVYYTANTSAGIMNAGVTYESGAIPSMAFSSANLGLVTFGIGADIFNASHTWNNPHEITLEVWVKSSGMGAGQTLGGIWGLTYGGRLHFHSSGPILFGMDTGTSLSTISSGGNYLDGNWHHVVGTQRVAGGELYVDGVVRNTTNSRWQGRTRWATNNVVLGRDNNNTGYQLNGNIAIARCYRKWLSATDVLQIYNAEKSRFGI